MKEYNKKWKNGDTFALRINLLNDKYKEYNNKYLIINKIGINKEGNDIVRIKITKTLNLNCSIDELNKLEYIKVNFFWYEDWDYYIERKNLYKLNNYVNKYNMIFLNVIELANYSKRKTKEFYDKLIYLGNYDLVPPKNEFYPEYLYHIRREFLILDRFQENMINSYEWFNKEKSDTFNEEFSKKQNAIVKGAKILINDYLDKYSKSEDKICKVEGKIKDSLTYVGEVDKK